MRKTFGIAVRFTLVTTVLVGILYPLAVTAFAHFAMRKNAEGQLIVRDGKILGSRIIGQSFIGDRYFHGRPSAAGNGYDASASGGSNLAASSQKLVNRVEGDLTKYRQSAGQAVPIDLVTASGSGLDPDITPAAAYFQVTRVAQARRLSNSALRNLISAHIQNRQFGVLGEPRVNVLELNLALEEVHP